MADLSEQYAKVLQKQKDFLASAHRRKGEIPRDRPSKQAICHDFNMEIHETRLNRESQDQEVSTVFIPAAYPPCMKALSELAKIKVRELQLETQHRGRYLLVKCVTGPNRLGSIMAIVEDGNEECVHLQLYHREDQVERPLTDILNEGMIMVIKEPCFKANSNGKYGVRVDHVSDVLWLGDRHTLLPASWGPVCLDLDKSALEWKEEGNEKMREKSYWKAIQCYTEAIECSTASTTTPELLETIRRNRSQAFLNIKNYDDALLDLSYLTTKPHESHNKKALFRIARALYALQRFSECSEVLKCLCKGYPEEKDGQDLQVKVTARLQEENEANYNFTAMYASAKQLTLPALDHATFQGPVEIRESQIGGRGMFTTIAVKAGDLLFCEKAFGYSFANLNNTPRPGSSRTTILINPTSSYMKIGTQADLINIIVQILSKNSSLAQSFHGFIPRGPCIRSV